MNGQTVKDAKSFVHILDGVCAREMEKIFV